MKARFIGSLINGERDPKENSVCTVFGLTFPLGEWLPVEGPAARKLATNPTFEVDTDGDEEACPTAEELRAELDRMAVRYHHNAGPAKLLELRDKALAEGKSPAPVEPEPEGA